MKGARFEAVSSIQQTDKRSERDAGRSVFSGIQFFV
jgi:hypothetical protein